MPDPFEPFDKLRDAIKRTVEAHDVEFMGWQVIPGNHEGDQRVCSMILRIKPEAFLDDDTKKDRKILEDMENEERALEARQRTAEEANRVREELTRNIGSGGIFDDSPEE